MHLSFFVKKKLNERVERWERRYWITFLPTILLFLVMLAIPIIVFFFVQKLFPDLFGGSIVNPLIVLFGSSYMLFTFLFFYVQFIDYHLDLWIITNERIIDIEQSGLFDRTISELELENVQDATSVVKGFFGTIFHYGDLVVATASATDSIIFRKIHNPDAVRQELIHLADLDKK